MVDGGKAMTLRRSPLFLLGFFPVVILLWAWADSLRQSRQWKRVLPTNRDQVRWIAVEESGIYFGARKVVSRSGREGIPVFRYKATGPFGEFYLRELTPGKPAIFPRPKRLHGLEENMGDATVERTRYLIPFWLILLCYLPLWLGISRWQVMRKKRKFSIPDDSAGDRGEGAPDRR